MKLYATVASERATKGQGGNEYLEMSINVMSESPTYRVRVVNDELLGIVYITLETLLFKKWSVVYETEQFYNVETKVKQCKYRGETLTNTKGKQQKGGHQHNFIPTTETSGGEVIEWCTGCEATRDSYGGIVE